MRRRVRPAKLLGGAATEPSSEWLSRAPRSSFIVHPRGSVSVPQDPFVAAGLNLPLSLMVPPVVVPCPSMLTVQPAKGPSDDDQTDQRHLTLYGRGLAAVFPGEHPIAAPSAGPSGAEAS